MYAVQLIAVFLLSLCIGIPCQAATFVKVSSSFSMTRDVHLDCSGADPGGDRDWYLSTLVHKFGYVFTQPVVRRSTAPV
jgi:hypothetical protein